MTAAERAAAPLLPALPPRRADEPGQFAFADERRVHRILEESGWTAIDMRPIDVVCGFEAKDLERYFTRFGPVGRVLADADEATRAKVIEAVRAGFEPFVRAGEMRFEAACWLIGGARRDAEERGLTPRSGKSASGTRHTALSIDPTANGARDDEPRTCPRGRGWSRFCRPG